MEPPKFNDKPLLSAILIQVELWQYQSNCGGCHFDAPTAWNTDPEHFERI